MLRRALKKCSTNTSDDNQKRVKKKHSKRIPLGGASDHDEVEQILEKAVLGGEGDVAHHLTESDNTTHIKHKSRKERKRHQKNKPQAAWEDEDDTEVRVKVSKKDRNRAYFKTAEDIEVTGRKYTQALKHKFEEVSGNPSWAKLRWEKSDSDQDTSDGEESSLLQSTGDYLDKSVVLAKGLIQMKKCTDANVDSPSAGKLRSVEFHPTAQVLLTGGMDRTLRLFQVDGKYNSKIQSVHLEKFPIYTAHFSSDGLEVIAGSHYKSFNYYDMMAGKVVNVPVIKGIEETQMKKFVVSPDGRHLAFLGRYGYIHLITAKTKEWISSVKMNGSVEAVTFNSDGSRMLSHGDDGRVYVWDMNTRDCVHQFVDHGCVNGTTIAASPNGRYIATGSNSGVVNLYDESCLSNHYPIPLRAVTNLTTSCSSLVFNSTTEILAMASNEADSAVKLLHIASQTVFPNFPDNTERLHIPYSMDFSLNSGYFTVGNNKGHAHLYRVQHYTSY